jgi:hypothetical protein
MINQSCTVTFDYFIPQDLSTTPWILLVSTGIHTHIPPPPTKQPSWIINKITKIIRQINDPNLTYCKYLLIKD